ncbi:MAG: T9SS type A sorting domain-containing protein [Crocinitomix sp.]|nr:T9SS type A sorting domain-containing protein [Crocinitomix sp.]
MRMLKRIIFPLAIICFTALQSFAQTTSESAIDQPAKVFLENLFTSGKTFVEITEEADAYFELKYPTLSPAELCEGEFRDGTFVKYQRWCSFWKNNLNADGTLGDFTKVARAATKNRDSREVICEDSDSPIEWTNINYTSNMGWQIDQGRASSLAFHPTDPDTYYIGAAWGGLWKTTDGGLTNTIVNDNLPLSAVSSIIIDPDNPDNMLVSLSDIVWYGPMSLGVYVSGDAGVNFSPTDLDWALTDNNRIYYMDQDPTDGDHILAATSDGIFRSTDFFTSNELVLSGDIRSVKFSRTNPDIVYAGGGSGQFYRSEDGGESFDLITDFGGGHVRIAVPLVDGSTRVVATHNTNLHTSTDNGLTFESKVLPQSNMVIEFGVGSEDVLSVGNLEVHSSDDFGDSFTVRTHWLGHYDLPHIHVDQRNVFVNPLNEDLVYYCNDGGIFSHDVTTNGFENLATDLIITQYYDIAVSQTEEQVLGGGSQDCGNVFRGEDGEWWRYAQTGDGMGQDIDPEYANRRYWSYQYGALRRWEDGDNTNIKPEGETGAWETPFKLDPNNSDRILVGYTSVYASDNNGDTWETVGDPVLGGTADLEQLAISPSNSEKIYAAKGRTLYVKEPGVEAWSIINTPVFQDITDLEVDPLDEDIVYICYAGFLEGKKVYMSEDSGENWTNISEDLPNLPFTALELYYDKPGALFVGTYGAVYYRDTMSTEWRKYGCLPNTSVNDIEIQYHTNKIYVGTHGRGMFEAPITLYVSSTGSELEEDNVQLSLYPNPAANNVTINSANLDLNNAVLSITDVTGRLINVEYSINSSNEITVNCSNLRQGNYFVTVVDGENNKHVLSLVISQ